MKQRTHTWIALRAISLIQEDSKTRELAEVLAPLARHSYIGCWLPDMQGFKKGHGIVGNHTFKNAPYQGKDKWRFILPQDKLLAALDSNLALHGYLKEQATLDAAWWGSPYKAVQNDGEHLPDCLTSLHDTIADLLLLGNPELDALVPGVTGYGSYLDSRCALSKEQVATFFFMMSHYIADCFMPCHADKRKLAVYENRKKVIHSGWEGHWEKEVGTYFSKEKLKALPDGNSQQIIAKARELDARFNLSFKLPISWPETRNDIWQNAILWCRASFAFSCDLFPPGQYPYDGGAQPLFSDYFKDESKLAEYDRIVLQSAVYAVAGTWKQLWRKFKK